VKTLIYVADGKPVAALVRGDRELNIVKLKNHLGANELEMAPAEVVEKITGCPVGFAGPVGLASVPLIVDPEVTRLTNFVIGANKNEKHLINVNYERDFKGKAIIDLVNAVAGELCPLCDGHLEEKRGIEVGNTFMLGTKYSVSMGAVFLDAEGKEKPFIMGSYGIGITRTPQAAIERYHDDKGIIWPKNIAPYMVEIIPLNYEKDEHKSVAEQIHKELVLNKIDCLIDDRLERAGVKFNDADLVGIPIRLVIGDKSLKLGKIEIRYRGESEIRPIEIKDVVAEVKGMMERIN